MILLDVNVLVYACRRDTERHSECHRWLSEQLAGDEPGGIYPETLAALVRITTHARIWKQPLSANDALSFCGAVWRAPTVVAVQPGDKHWAIFRELCGEARAKGNLVMNAWLAAVAIENGCTLITTDTDFARFKRLRWRSPL